jgi:hypothetical protein
MQLQGHVIWEGRPAQPDALQQLPITIHLRQIDREPAAETDLDAITDEKGYFLVQIGHLPLGVYEWRAKGAQYLSNAGKVQIGMSQVTSVEMGSMRPGDVTNDNVVNARDFNMLTGSFNKSVKDPGFVAAADFTGDDVVSIRDFNLLTAHFGQVGN